MFEIPFHKSLRARIMAFTGTLFLMLALLIVISILIFVFTTEQDAWRARQGEAAESAAVKVADYLQQNESILSWLDKYGSDEIKENPVILQKVLRDNPAFLEIIFVDEGGNLLYNAARSELILANQFTILQSEWFRAANSGQKIYTRVQTSPRNESYIIFAMPSQKGGVIAAQIQMDILWQKVAQIRFGETGSIYIVNQHGQVIAHPDRQIVLSNRTIGNTALFEAILRSPEKKWVGNAVNFDNVKVIAVSTPVELTDWIVISELPQEEAYAASRQAATLIPTLVFFLITIVIYTFRKMLNRAIIQPLNFLRDGAHQIGEGNFTFRIEVPRKDEFGEVMIVFNDMAANLEKQQDNLQKAIAYEYESQRARELDILLRASEATSSSLDFDTVLHTLAAQLLEISGFESCFISEWDQETNTITGRLDLSRTFWREGKRDSYSMSDYPRSNQVLQTGVPIILQGNFEAEEKQWMQELKRTAVIILALQTSEKTIGLVEMATTKKEVLFNQHVLPICQEILAKAAFSLIEPLSANDPRILFEIEEALIDASGAEVCSFSEWDKAGNRILNLAVVTNMSWASGQGTRFNPDLEPWQQAIEQGKIVKLVKSDEKATEAIVFDGAEIMDVESLIIFPLQKGNERIGVIELYDFNHKKQVTDEQITLLRTIADKASYSIENARLFEKTQQLSLTDHLTQLFNMRYFLNIARLEFERIHRHNTTISIVMADIDHFKKINDSYGHSVGDQVLHEIAARIKNSVRTVDIAARYGGEEFIILMPETGLNEACLVAERVRQIIANCPIEIKNNEISLTLSLGVAEMDVNTKSVDELIKHADKALYKAKADGRNRLESYLPGG